MKNVIFIKLVTYFQGYDAGPHEWVVVARTGSDPADHETRLRVSGYSLQRNQTPKKHQRIQREDI